MTGQPMDQRSREPAVAGMFYPSQPRQIEQAIDGWLAWKENSRHAWRAALVPHAGWVYSGRVTARVLARIKFPSTVLIFCPKHQPGGADCAVAPWGRWLFPGGAVDADVELSRQLAAGVDGLELDDRPHRAEHAIEVQLPLIARLAPESRIVGITIGRIDLAQCHALAAAIGDIVHDRLDSMMFLISSDMNHFASDAESRRLDELALQRLEETDPDGLYATCYQHRISMCGMLPAVIVLKTLDRLGLLHQAVRVDYATSADVSGDEQRVVGYAGVLFD